MSLEQSESNDPSEYSDNESKVYTFSLKLLESNDMVEPSREDEEETFHIGNVVQAPLGPKKEHKFDSGYVNMMPSYVYGHIVENSTGNMVIVSFLNGKTQHFHTGILEKQSKLLSDNYYNTIYRNKTAPKNIKKFMHMILSLLRLEKQKK